MLDGMDVFRVAGARMRYLAERQNLLAQNIANADTPRYQARDLGAFTFDSVVARNTAGAPLRMAGSNPAHITEARASSAVMTRRSSNNEDPDGNTVNLEDQMLKQADVARSYEMATTVYRRSASLLRTAMGGR